VSAYRIGDDGVLVEIGQGWSSYRGKWGPLGAFLEDSLGVPADEAERLAEAALAGWRDRGGADSAPWTWRAVKNLSIAFAQFAVIGALLVAFAAGLVWLVVAVF
jgi:hypothetical protein